MFISTGRILPIHHVRDIDYPDDWRITIFKRSFDGSDLSGPSVDVEGLVSDNLATVDVSVKGPYVTLTVNITSGIPTLGAYFRVSTEIPNPAISYKMDFEGDGVIDHTGATFDDITHDYITEGIYHPTITVTDDQENVYTDTIAVIVLNRAKMDALLKGKWEKMKGALVGGSIEEGLKYVTRGSRQEYRDIFELLSSQLPSLVSGMREIDMIYLTSNVAEYYIQRLQRGVDISYFIYFFKDAEGIWRIERF